MAPSKPEPAPAPLPPGVEDIEIPQQAECLERAFAGLPMAQIRYQDGTTAWRTICHEIHLEEPTVGELVTSYGLQMQAHAEAQEAATETEPDRERDRGASPA